MLLTAHADTEAAIASINKVGLDHYLMKPRGPAGGQPHPILDDLLGDWWATTPMPFEGIRVAGIVVVARLPHGEGLSGRNRIPYQWLDIPEGRRKPDVGGGPDFGGEAVRLRCFFPDGTSLIEPDLAERPEGGDADYGRGPFYDLIIIGGGSAGWARRLWRVGGAIDGHDRAERRPAARPAPVRASRITSGFPRAEATGLRPGDAGRGPERAGWGAGDPHRPRGRRRARGGCFHT